MLTLQTRRPTSFLPIYSLILAGLHLWLVHLLTGAGREWIIFDPAAPFRFVPVALATLLGLGSLALTVVAAVHRWRGTRTMGLIAFRVCVVVALAVLYALLHLAGHWLGFL
jgi:hypothetical protein